MSNSLKKTSYLLILILALLAAGFYRDFLFKSINALLQSWDNDMDYVMPGGLRFFEEMEYDSIVNVKWFLTFFFSMVYLAIAMLAIRVLFQNKRYVRITIYTYIAILALSSLCILSGKLITGLADGSYEIARYLMGIVQSPLILMVLIPGFKLTEKQNSTGGND